MMCKTLKTRVEKTEKMTASVFANSKEISPWLMTFSQVLGHDIKVIFTERCELRFF